VLKFPIFWFRKEEEIKEARKQNKMQGKCSSSPHLPQPMLEFDIIPHPSYTLFMFYWIFHDFVSKGFPKNLGLRIEIDRKNLNSPNRTTYI